MILPGALALRKCLPHTTNEIEEDIKAGKLGIDEVVEVFPLWEDYWLQEIERQLLGPSKKTVFEKAVKAFPNLLRLWCDYLRFLIAENADHDIIKLTYTSALRHCGHHFNGDSLWDLVLEFEKQDRKALVKLYLQLIDIPLYEYNKFYTQFVEIGKSYDLTEIMDEATLQAYVKGFGHNLVDGLTLVERHQAFDDYVYKIHQKTQSQVVAKWEYEEKLIDHKFKIEPVDASTWWDYISWSRSHDAVPDAISVYERAIIVLGLLPKVWLSYLAYLNQAGVSRESQLEVFRRGADIVPWDDTDDLGPRLRILWHKLIGSNEMLEKWLSDLAAASPRPLVAITQVTQALVAGLSDLHQAIHDPKYPPESLAVLVVAYLKTLDAVSVRRFFNDHILTTSKLTTTLKRSELFWKFYVNFEGYEHFNTVNLAIVVMSVTTTRQLLKGSRQTILAIAELICRANYGYPEPFEVNHLPELARRQAGHPGLTREHIPEITNPQFCRTRLSADFDGISAAPPFPQFKNVEKLLVQIVP